MGTSNLTPEVIFLKYAFPCAEIILEDKRITLEEFEALKKAAVNSEDYSKKNLERIFASAVRRLKETAKEAGLEYWSVEAIRNYFRDNHDKYIDANDGNYAMFGTTLKELCRVRKAKITRMLNEEKNIGEVIINGKNRPIFLIMTPTAKPGDEVYVHYSYSVEFSS